MTSQLKEIKFNCLDFDDVCYEADAIKDYYKHFADVFGETLYKMFPEAIDLSSAIQLAYDGYKSHGDSVSGLMDWARKNNIGGPSLRLSFFHAYHKNLALHFPNVAPHVFSKVSKLVPAFEKVRGIVSNGIASHGCADYWVKPLLTPMGLKPFIQPDAIFGLADSDFLKKSTHPDLVQKCREALGAEPQETCFPDDNVPNLETNKAFEPKMKTVHIHNGHPLDKKPSYIDFEFRDLGEYLKALHAAHNDPPKLILI